MPGTAAGTVRRKVRTVASATTSGATGGASSPGSTMFGLRIIPSSSTPWRANAVNTSRSAAVVAASQASTP